MVHLGPFKQCASTCDCTARKMRPEPSRAGPRSRRVGPLPGAHTLPTGSPATRGARPPPSPGKRALWTPARPFLALLLLVSIKQVRAVCIITVTVIIISCMYFLTVEALQASCRQFGKCKTVLRQ